MAFLVSAITEYAIVYTLWWRPVEQEYRKNKKEDKYRSIQVIDSNVTTSVIHQMYWHIDIDLCLLDEVFSGIIKQSMINLCPNQSTIAYLLWILYL